MAKISNASNGNEINRVDSPFNEDSKNIFFCQGCPNFKGGMARKFRENGQKQGNLLLCKLESGQFSCLYSLASKSLHYFGFSAC